jgi:cephalosporin hydroxylase
MRMLTIDEAHGRVIVQHEDGSAEEHPLDTPEAFEAVSAAWLRCGWDVKYVYGFTWMGRPVIQLPEDMIRIQEVIWRVRPDVIVETGVAHGGSLIFYASLFEAHPLANRITLIQGSSGSPGTLAAVRHGIDPHESVLVVLDSNHSRAHVEAELDLYAPLVSSGSYIVACDGIMAQVAGAPRSAPDWAWNNPIAAVEAFLARNPDFVLEEPGFAFNEGVVRQRVTYWPKSFLRRR